MNFPNEEGVDVVHPLMEKSKERSGGVQDGVPFSFLFEGSNMRVEKKEKKKKDAMEIKTNEEFARTTQARRESEGRKSVVLKKKKKNTKKKKTQKKTQKKKTHKKKHKKKTKKQTNDN